MLLFQEGPDRPAARLQEEEVPEEGSEEEGDGGGARGREKQVAYIQLQGMAST